MNYPHIATLLYNAPLMITPEKAEVIEQVFRAYNEGNAQALPKAERAPMRPELASATFRETPSGYMLSDRGVAVVPIIGSLVQRGGLMDAMSGMTSYQAIAQQIDAAMADPRVRGVLLEVDSPGGEGAGVFDLAAQIRTKSKQKPIWGIANEMAFSAGYAILSATSRVSVPALGMAGSIGVIMLHVDQSIYDAKRGLVYTPIFAGARKNDFSGHEPLSAEALNTAQKMVDRMYSVFVDTVAANRNIDAENVRATEAGIFHGPDAVSNGLADMSLNFGDTVQAMVDDINASKGFFSYGSATSAANLEVNTMDPNKTTAPAPAATSATTNANELETATAAARAAGVDEGLSTGTAAGRAEGIAAERARIGAIMGHAEAEGREPLAKHLAFHTDIAVEAAVATLTAATRAIAPNALAKAMASVTNPRVGADFGGEQNKPAPLSSAQVFDLRQQQVDKARGR